MPTRQFGPDVLSLDLEQESERISQAIRSYVEQVHRRGLVVALSGGIDSSLVAAVAVRALGRDRVFGVHMPERESSPETIEISRAVSTALGIESATEDITSALEAFGAYTRRDDAIRTIFPEYGPGYRSKIVLPSVTDADTFRLYSVVIVDPQGSELSRRLTPEAYLGIVAATNFKQRVRKAFEYYYADRLNYVASGTPNRLEFDQGFFVKLGDGAADIKPIAHLYKTQVYELAAYLDIPDVVLNRPSTTDTYSLPQSQEEFYFSLPHRQMDLVLYGKNHAYPIAEIAAAVDLSVEQVQRVYRDIDQKRRTTRYLHLPPQLVEPINEVN